MNASNDSEEGQNENDVSSGQQKEPVDMKEESD